MASTMLQLIQQATAEMGLSVPNYVAGNTAQDTVQQMALLNAVGYELTRQFEWQWQVAQHIITVDSLTITADTTEGSDQMTNVTPTTGIDDTYQINGPGINQACYVNGIVGTTIELSQPATSTNTGQAYTLGKTKFDLPEGYDRQINRTHWDKSKHWEMLGPESAQQWEWLLSGYISTGPRIRYRIFGNYFQIWPMVTDGEVLGFEYMTNAWARSSTGTPKTSMTVDTDTCVFPDRLMVLGLKLKYFEIKGFDTEAFLRDYTAQLNIAKAADAGAVMLSFSPRISTILIGWEQIPDAGYGS